MEELNKTQLVLLAIFITLVTSSATGVIVVTLMDQAPQGITQTINRVVERTVETVVSPGKIEKTEVTQVVREDDNIIASIKKTRQSLVRAVRDAGEGVADIGPVVETETQQASIIDALKNISADFQEAAISSSLSGKLAEAEISKVGTIVSSDGIIVTSNKILYAGGKYLAILSNGTKVPIVLLKNDENHGISIFKISTAQLKEKITVVPLTARSYDQVSLGQTVIAIDFDDNLNTVSMGYISGMKTEGASSTPVIRTNIKPTENWSGRPIIDINGFLVGVYGLNNEIVPYPTIKALIDSSIGASVENTAQKTN